ncbi:MAG TPA: cysteine desulfurase, partial [Gammaproteobacteria bacterium]|nr:cysteine desulfurase [Gammaproteobacteria bacterium]
MEHHSNIVPWQLLCERMGAQLKVIQLTQTGELDFEHFNQLLTSKTKLVAICHASNVLGTINPVKNIIDAAHAIGVPVLLDGAQAAPHLPVDVQALDCDFYTFSGHKVYAPTGIGILYAKATLLEKMSPYQSGGGMISHVSFDKTEFSPPPHKFEAGTPNIAGVIGLGAAIDFCQTISMPKIAEHEQQLLHYATTQLTQIAGLRIIGTAKNKVAVISFILTGIHPHDIATILDNEGIAVRAGHHCAMPLMDFYQLPATTRVSFGIYNTQSDVDALIMGLKKVIRLFNDA